MNKKQSPTLNIAVSELRNFWQGGIPITLEIQKNKELRALGNDGYIIRASKDGNHLTITSSGGLQTKQMISSVKYSLLTGRSDCQMVTV